MATEFVGIELQLMGAEGVRRDLENLDRLLNSFRGRKQFDMGLSEARAQVIAYKGELEKLKREQSRYARGSDEWKSYAAAIEEVRAKLWNAQQAVREFGYASREAGMTFKETFNSISSKVAHAGSALQSFGNAMTQLTSPFKRLTDGIVMGAGYKVLNQFTEGVENSFTRADVMRKYPRVMQAMGYSADEAQKSIDRLDASVQGLPTSLDDIVGMSQRFTMTVGDLEKGTNLAIAANNAFLASMSTDTQKYQGMMQLQDVLGGKKMNAREWYSLANSMMPAIRMMGESLGLEGDALDEYVAKVQQGKIANQEFIDTLIKAGTSDNGKIRTIAMESLDTWEAFFSRIKTAASRLGYKGIIEPLNSLVETVTGGKFKSVNLFLDDFIVNRIDKMQSSVKKWIESHPEEITNFFKELSKIKFGDLISGYIKGLELTLKVAETVGTAIGRFPGVMKFIGGLFGTGGMIGRTATIIGGLLKGTRHIWGLIGALAVKGIGKTGIFGKIAEMFGGKNNPEKTIAEAPKMMTTLRNTFSSLQGTLVLAGKIAIPTATIFGVTKAYKSVLKDLKEIAVLVQEVDWWHAAWAMGGFGVFVGAFVKAGSKFQGREGLKAGLKALEGEAIVGAITTLAALFADLDMAILKESFKSFRDLTSYISEGIENLKSISDVGEGESALKKVNNAITLFNEIIAVVKGELDPVSHQMAGGLDPLPKTYTDNLSSLATAVADIKKTAETLIEIGDIDIDSLKGIGDKVTELLDGLADVYNALNGFATGTSGGFGEGFLRGLAGNKTADALSDPAAKLSNMISALGEIGKIVSKLKELDTQLGDGAIDTARSVRDKLYYFAKHLQLIWIKFKNSKLENPKAMMDKMHNFSVAFGSIRNIFKKMKEIDGVKTKGDGTGKFSAISKIKNLIDQLKEVFGEGSGISELRTDIQSFVTDVQSLLDSFDSLNGEHEISVSVKLKGNKVQGADTVVNKINAAQRSIKRAIENLKSYYSKEITIEIRRKIKVSGAIRSGIDTVRGIANHSVTESTGGLIYRADGGGVPFKRRGTDTVPAMLTPGEYVHNKRAVDTFGIEFMRKVNSLDIKGAMHELMHRAGGMANVNRGTVITNNNYNNQKVVINNNNPTGAGFTFKSASRFVGAV